MSDLSAVPPSASVEPPPPEPAAATAPTSIQPVAAPREWKIENSASFARGRGLLKYVDAVLFSLDPPVEGGRVDAAGLLLKRAIEALTDAVEPNFTGAAAEHAFWSSLSPQPLPASWRSKFELEDEVLDARKVAWAGLQKLEAPQRERTWKLVTRVLKFVAIAGAGLGLVLGIVSLVRNRPPPPGLLIGRPINTSSKLGRESGNPKLLFHTELEFRPWAEWDLGQPTKLHEVVVSNRTDCCADRALPLVVEVSDDRSRWVEVARRTEPFGAYLTIPFNEISARYLRLRVDRESFLHLEYVEAR